MVHKIDLVARQSNKFSGQMRPKREVKDDTVEVTAAPPPSVMSWFYLTPAPIDNNAWKDAMDGNINVSKLENRFKYEADGARFEMMKNIPEFKKDKVPALKMEFGKYCKSIQAIFLL